MSSAPSLRLGGKAEIALVVLSVNREKTVLANAPRILAAIDAATVGSYVFIDCSPVGLQQFLPAIDPPFIGACFASWEDLS